MGLNRRKLKDWATRHMLRSPPAVRFALFHLGRHTASLVASLATEGAPEDQAAQVERETADEVAVHIEAWPGRQQYFVRAYGDKDDETVAEFAFHMIANVTDAASDLATLTPEHATAGGDVSGHPHAMVTIQQMRHNEGLVRMVAEMSRSAGERDAQIIASQQRQLDMHEERRFEFSKMIEGMYSERQQRELEHAAATSDSERKDKLMTMVTKFVLPEIAKRAGLGGPGVDDVTKEITAIFLKLPTETQDEVLAKLPDDDRKSLLNIFESAGKEATKH